LLLTPEEGKNFGLRPNDGIEGFGPSLGSETHLSTPKITETPQKSKFRVISTHLMRQNEFLDTDCTKSLCAWVEMTGAANFSPC